MMSFFCNTEQKFSSLMKLLHWIIAILLCLQFYLIYYNDTLPKDAPERIQNIVLHKSFGVSLLILTLLMIVARHLGKRPVWPKEMPSHERFLAKIVHWSLYLVLLLMPITGYLMSSFAGYPVAVFGFTLPNLVTKAPEVGKMMYHYHALISQVIYGLVGLHILGALKHHFIDKNNILKRMFTLC